MSNIIEIKQHPDKAAYAVGLGKYGRSKMPGTWEMMQAGIGPDNRWITGLDENAASVRKIQDPTAREERFNELKTLRENLENLTGLDLQANFASPFWNSYIIKLKDQGSLDLSDPFDVIKYHVILANNFAAPEIAIADTPEYNNAKYYLSRTEDEQSNLSNRKREKDKAVSKLFALYENKNRLLLVGKYILGTAIKESMSLDTLYNLVSDYISDPKDLKGSNARKFLSVADKTIEELQYKITAIDAANLFVIRLRDGVYQRGQITLGKSLDDVASWFANPKNSVEFESILDEVKEKKILG